MVEADVHSYPKISSGGSDPVHPDMQESNMDEQLGESTAQVDEAEMAQVDGAETDEFGDFQETDGYGNFQKTGDIDASLEGAVMESALEAAQASDLDIYHSDVEVVKVGEWPTFSLYSFMYYLILIQVWYVGENHKLHQLLSCTRLWEV